jgi:hypothetical protein
MPCYAMIAYIAISCSSFCYAIANASSTHPAVRSELQHTVDRLVYSKYTCLLLVLAMAAVASSSALCCSVSPLLSLWCSVCAEHCS